MAGAHTNVLLLPLGYCIYTPLIGSGGGVRGALPPLVPLWKLGFYLAPIQCLTVFALPFGGTRMVINLQTILHLGFINKTYDIQDFLPSQVPS